MSVWGRQHQSSRGSLQKIVQMCGNSRVNNGAADRPRSPHTCTTILAENGVRSRTQTNPLPFASSYVCLI